MELKHYKTLAKLSSSMDPKVLSFLMDLIDEGESLQKFKTLPPEPNGVRTTVEAIRNYYWRDSGIADLLEAIAADLK